MTLELGEKGLVLEAVQEQTKPGVGEMEYILVAVQIVIITIPSNQKFVWCFKSYCLCVSLSIAQLSSTQLQIMYVWYYAMDLKCTVRTCIN